MTTSDTATRIETCISHADASLIAVFSPLAAHRHGCLVRALLQDDEI